MSIEAKIIKDIPKEQIKNFEDKVIYNTAMLTREYVKGIGAYPYLTGRLERTEAASPIVKLGEAEYGLTSGVDYAKRVWNYKNVNWTNPGTMPQWYYTAYRQKGKILLNNAVEKALKELK
jgi:hypothetical protein